MKITNANIHEEIADLTEEDLAEVLTFIRLYRHVPEFREELHARAAPGERIPPFDVVDALMEKWKGRLVTE